MLVSGPRPMLRLPPDPTLRNAVSAGNASENHHAAPSRRWLYPPEERSDAARLVGSFGGKAAASHLEIAGARRTARYLAGAKNRWFDQHSQTISHRYSSSISMKLGNESHGDYRWRSRQPAAAKLVLSRSTGSGVMSCGQWAIQYPTPTAFSVPSTMSCHDLSSSPVWMAAAEIK